MLLLWFGLSRLDLGARRVLGARLDLGAGVFLVPGVFFGVRHVLRCPACPSTPRRYDLSGFAISSRDILPLNLFEAWSSAPPPLPPPALGIIASLRPVFPYGLRPAQPGMETPGIQQGSGRLQYKLDTRVFSRPVRKASMPPFSSTPRIRTRNARPSCCPSRRHAARG